MQVRPAVIAIVLIVRAGVLPASDYEAADSIRRTAVDFVRGQIGTNADTEIVAASLDPRLRLARCDQPLQAFQIHRTRTSKRTIGVRCSGTRPWSIYIPVAVHEFKPVIVTTRSMVQGEILEPADMTLQRREVGQLRRGYYLDTGPVIGKQVRRPLAAGAVINKQVLKTAVSIRRGDTVALVAHGPFFDVRAPGKALEDAAPGERLKVKNLRSQRVVEGLVTRSGDIFVN